MSRESRMRTVVGRLKEKERNRRRRQKGKRNKVVLRLEQFGTDAVAAYQASSGQPQSGHSKQRMAKLKREILQGKLAQALTQSLYHRIINLNIVSEQPLLNVGWSCVSCKLSHHHPLFFDIDHIIPLSEKGTSMVENLQILCPNCHKKKTIQCDGFITQSSFRN